MDRQSCSWHVNLGWRGTLF